MRSANIASLPAMPSASVMQPSLADWTIAARNRSLTLITEPSLANMVEPPDGAPPFRQAFSLTLNVSSILSLPLLMVSKTTATVINLARLAGGILSSGALANRTVPVSASISSASAALVSNGCNGLALIWAARSDGVSAAENRSIARPTAKASDRDIPQYPPDRDTITSGARVRTNPE